MGSAGVTSSSRLRFRSKKTPAPTRAIRPAAPPATPPAMAPTCAPVSASLLPEAVGPDEVDEAGEAGDVDDEEESAEATSAAEDADEELEVLGLLVIELLLMIDVERVSEVRVEGDEVVSVLVAKGSVYANICSSPVLPHPTKK